jgi:uncharacterized protein (DUF885 family)
MGLNLKNWDALPKADKDAVINFLRGNCKIDLESPANTTNKTGAYPITDGKTSGGHPKKYGDEYRMYIKSLVNCPPFLAGECKSASKPYKARIGGNAAIKAIMDYGGLVIGNN